MRRSAYPHTHAHTRIHSHRDMKARVPMHHSGMHTHSRTHRRVGVGEVGHTEPPSDGEEAPLMEGRVWRKVLPEGAWRRRWHWSAPGHSWPSYRCPEFPRQARVWPWPQAAPRQGGQRGRHLSLVWPQAGPVWLPLSDQEEGTPSLAVPVSGAVSHPSCQLRTPHHWFPCSPVGSGSPAHWLVPPAHWLVPPAHWVVPPAHWLIPLLTG